MSSSAPTPASPSRLRVGLVLGGGGVTGMAYHAGALSALELDLGWDVRSADLVVGTSAGAIIAGLLRSGVPATDLAARGVGIEPIASPAHLSEGLHELPELPPFGWRSLLRVPRRPSGALLAGIARNPGRVDPLATAFGLLADGLIDVADQQERLREVMGDRWPQQHTWICTVRQHDLRRVVFGRDRTAPPAAAIAASYAVPGYFSAVEIDGTTYIDGGVRSPTNAGVAASPELDLDLVVVSSPMSTDAPGLVGIDAWARRHAAAKLRRELARLQARRIPTVVLQPSTRLAALMGSDLMNGEHTAQIVGAALLDAGAQLREPVVRTLVEGLRPVPRRTAPAG